VSFRGSSGLLDAVRQVLPISLGEGAEVVAGPDHRGKQREVGLVSRVATRGHADGSTLHHESTHEVRPADRPDDVADTDHDRF
jgi:hypothetical protein